MTIRESCFWNGRAVRRWLPLLLGTTFLSAAGVRAETPPPPTLYEAAVRALDEGLPQVAVYKLRAFLPTAPPGEIRGKASVALARALLQVGDPAAALAALSAEYPAATAAPDEANFWFGQVYASLHRWPEALAAYTGTAEARGTGPDLQAAARFGQAEALLALGRAVDASAAFKRLLDDPRCGEPARLRCAEIALDTRHLKDAATYLLDVGSTGEGGPPRIRNPYAAKEHAYLLGRLRLATGQPALAQEMFEAALADPDGLSDRLLVVSYWGWCQACLDQNHLEQAQDALEFLIDKHPEDPFLPATLAWLEQLYREDPAADLSELRRWAADADEASREAQARLTLARLEAHAGRPERAEQVFASFGDDFPASPLRARALFDLAGLQLQLGRLTQAHATVASARALTRPRSDVATADAAPAPDDLAAELEVLDARVSLAQNDSAAAALRFEALSRRLGAGAQAEAAAFDAVLGWLRALDGARFTAAEQDFSRSFPQSKLTAEFLLEEGLARAGQTTASGDGVSRQAAANCLRQFLREQPASPRAAEARVALAELAFDRTPPNVAVSWREIGAPELLPVANPEGAPPSREANAAAAAEQDRASYLAIWLADAPGPAQDENKAIALAKTYLEKHAGSPLAPEARMKLCEIYFGREDYPDAQTQLELLAEAAPNSGLAEPALYLAGLAASRSMSPAGLDKAVTLFAAAAHANGPLQLAARLRQAEVQNRLGKPDDALILYAGVIAATADRPLAAGDLESRCEALSGRGETLFAQAAHDPAQYAEAAKAFQLLAQTPGASLLWRRQALTQQGAALEKMGDTAAALAAYDDALDASDHPENPTAPAEPEWTWFYRAGNDAARLLESQSQWPAAIAIYKKLAAANGPLKSEFEALLTRRRLEHFIWEE
jgi:outer membrane protein assembly factor BamD (BamD/ComL family)